MRASESPLVLRRAVRYHCAAVAPESVNGGAPCDPVARDDQGFAAYWRAVGGARLTAGGAAYEERFTGPDAIAQAQRAWRDLRSLLRGDAAAQVRAFCGFAFAPRTKRDEYWQGWPDGLLVLPEWLAWELPGGERGAVRVTAVRSADEQPWPPQLQMASPEHLRSQRRADHDGTVAKNARPEPAPGMSVASERERPANARAGPATSGRTRRPDRAEWCAAVAQAAAAVREGRLDKVVLARLEERTAAQPIRVDLVLRALERDYPDATVFAVRQGGQVFVGATPERLVALRHGEIAVDCLAGTARRGTATLGDGGGAFEGGAAGDGTSREATAGVGTAGDGTSLEPNAGVGTAADGTSRDGTGARTGVGRMRDADPAAEAASDEDAARALLASAKDRVEHDAVVRGVKADLADVAHGLETAAQPAILRLKNVLHLYTPVRAQSRAGVTALTLLARLHPTAAVAGLPRGAALAAIERWEGMDRGWYAAPIGWVDPDEEGEFVVALRSALIEGNRAVLYAGVGIVADSQSDAEWMETEWKLAPMRTAVAAAGAAPAQEALRL